MAISWGRSLPGRGLGSHTSAPMWTTALLGLRAGGGRGHCSTHCASCRLKTPTLQHRAVTVLQGPPPCKGHTTGHEHAPIHSTLSQSASTRVQNRKPLASVGHTHYWARTAKTCRCTSITCKPSKAHTRKGVTQGGWLQQPMSALMWLVLCGSSNVLSMTRTQGSQWGEGSTQTCRSVNLQGYWKATDRLALRRCHILGTSPGKATEAWGKR